MPNPYLSAMTSAAHVSKFLFEAREEIEMWADVVESQTGKPARHTRQILATLDNFRVDQGWNKDSFGGEEGPVHVHIYEPEPDTNRLHCSCGSTLYTCM